MRAHVKSAVLFVGFGLALYACLFAWAEWQLYRTGKANAFFKIATSREQTYDWVILGASHALPLGFADFNATMEAETNARIINLAATGAGPLYNRFVLEQFLEGHTAKSLLYVVDSFAFYSPTWNENRFSDAKLLRRTPFDWGLAHRLWRYCIEAKVSPRAFLDYVSGFSKINNRERFDMDAWEGEKQFDRIYRPSASATRSRVAYLYDQGTSEAAPSRYLAILEDIISTAQKRGMRVTLVKPPVPAAYRGLLPDEVRFDAALARIAQERQAAYRDFSAAMEDPRFYFDTDHLNRAGTSEFFDRHLRSVLMAR